MFYKLFGNFIPSGIQNATRLKTYGKREQDLTEYNNSL